MPDRFLQAAPLAAMIEAERPTLAGAVPTIWTDLLAYLEQHPADISSLKEAVVGGSACPPALMHAFSERGMEIIHAWGMTEMSPLGSVSRPPRGATGDEAWAYRYTQGRVPASVAARIVGPTGEVMPNDGEAVGELEVRGPWITNRYYGEDIPDPEKFRDGWLRTGDVGTLSAERLPDADRPRQGRHQVRRRVDLLGRAGEPPDGAPGGARGGRGRRARPEVGRAPAGRCGAEGERHARPRTSCVTSWSDRIARWQLPERWTFIESVPKTSVGKFDKKVLRAQYADGELTVETLS